MEPEPLSKTRRKKQMLALQDLGEALIELPVETLREFDLPEALFDAVLEAKRITQRGALKRQFQYVGRLMREVDGEAIREKLDAYHGVSRAHTARFHVADRWRERLLASDAAFVEFARQFPAADVPRLRALVRAARLERTEQKPPRSFRLLFREIRVVVEAAAIAGHPPEEP